MHTKQISLPGNLCLTVGPWRRKGGRWLWIPPANNTDLWVDILMAFTLWTLRDQQPGSSQNYHWLTQKKLESSEWAGWLTGGSLQQLWQGKPSKLCQDWSWTFYTVATVPRHKSTPGVRLSLPPSLTCCLHNKTQKHPHHGKQTLGTIPLPGKQRTSGAWLNGLIILTLTSLVRWSLALWSCRVSNSY